MSTHVIEPEADRVIDVHTHAMPLPFLRALAARGLADLDELGAGVVRLHPDVAGLAERAPVPCPPAQYDLGARLALLDECQVDVHAVSAPPFLFATQMADDARALALVAEANDALAEFAAAAPGRLLPIATVSAGRAGAAAEARRCLEELGFAGVTLGTSGGGRELDHPVNEELWEYLASAGAFVLLHPSGTPSPGRLEDYHLTQLLGFPVETAMAVARLIFGGVLDRHSLRICLSHGGGCVQALAPRLDLGWRRKDASRTIARPPSTYLARFYYDTAVFDTPALRRLIDEVGVERVLMGTDAPFDLADVTPRETVQALGLAPDQARLVLGGTAVRLLHGEPAPVGEGSA
ncbi:amidohydrolase [Actinomadura cremea]|nr:amidohydrolase [Actinomadura cremea]